MMLIFLFVGRYVNGVEVLIDFIVFIADFRFGFRMWVGFCHFILVVGFLMCGLLTFFCRVFDCFVLFE